GRWQPGEAVFASLAARQRSDASRWEAAAGAEDVALAAGEAYLLLVREGAVLSAATTSLALATSIRTELEGRTAAGVGAPAEVLTAKSREATARARQTQARASVRSAALRLGTLLNLPPDVILAAADDVPLGLRLIDPSRTEASFVADGLAARAELRRADSESCAAAEERRAARIAPWVPTITVDAGTGGFGDSFGDLRSRDEVRVGVEWTIGEGGILDAARAARADARLRQAEVGAAAARAQVVRQVREAFGLVTAGREAIAAAQVAVDDARLAEAAFRERVRGGVSGPLELVVAQEALQAAWVVWIDALVDHDRAQLRLLHATGKRGP
ncbi:MAG: TolC family protein, partial [Planctomycetia bacterium]|nr:TolC family protein [Planctomycetia bacterium]